MKFVCTNFLLFNSILHASDDASDPVLRQYTELPYPDFSEAQFKMERIHYGNEDRQVGSRAVLWRSRRQLQGPMVVSPALTMENLNHYLYSGREHFQSGFRVTEVR